jgi:proteasome lid subunit RPN8/RPN11
MFGRKNQDGRGQTPVPAKTDRDVSAPSPVRRISIRDIPNTVKAIRRSFPGPRGAEAILRVAIERSAYADLIAHAKESLEVEVCGVLAGQVCEDDEGLFLHVEAVISGTAANQASTHVTFTQATWNAIHQTLERDYPKLKMLGWYHTHPGFGVEFSEMDLFIQKNFFSGPTQIALVTDPLSGAVAIVANTLRGIEYLSRFWVDGREQPCRAPESVPGNAPETPPATGDPGRSAQALEARVSQLVLAVDDLRTSYHRFLTFVGIVFCLAIVVAVGYTVYNQYISRFEPPRLNSYAPVPVQIGDKTVLLGVGVVEWQVPPELNAVFLQLEQLKREAAEKAVKEAEGKEGKAPSPTGAPTNPPPDVVNPKTANEPR